jgi:hypothetical protein
MSGQSYLSSLGDTSSKRQWIMSLLNLNIVIAYIKSTSIAIHLRKLKNFGQQFRCHSRCSQFCTCHLEAYRIDQFFPIHCSMDLPHVCNTSPWLPCHFQDCQTYFCLPLTSSNFTFAIRTPTLGAYDEARLIVHSHEAQVRFCQFQPERSDHRMAEVKILCEVPDWQLSSLVQICTLSLHPF